MGSIFFLQIEKNVLIPPNFLVRNLCEKAQFPHSFGRLVRNSAETVPFHKIYTLRNYVKFRYLGEFMQ